MTQGRHAAPKRPLRDPAAKPVGGARKAPRRSVVPSLPVGRAGTEVTAAAVAPVVFLSAACVLGLGASSGEPAAAETGRSVDRLLRPAASAPELVGRHRAAATDLERADAVSVKVVRADQAVSTSPADHAPSTGSTGSAPTAEPSAPQSTGPTANPTTAPTLTADPTPSPDPTDEPVIALPTALPTILPEVPLVP